MEYSEIDKLNEEISHILSKYLFKKNTIDIRNQIANDLVKLYYEKFEEINNER